MRLLTGAWATLALGALCLPAAAQVVVVEPGHTAFQLVDSAFPLHPSQTLLDTTMPPGEIESIAVDKNTGDLYVQLSSPPGACPSQTTHVFKISGGVVTLVAANTGFGICARGTDMHLDPGTGLLVTEDANGPITRLASVNPANGALGTWSTITAGLNFGATFGMQFSTGAGGSDVPAGDIVWMGDVSASGIHSSTFGGAVETPHVPGGALPGGGGGDDMVIQPNGDWVWVGDFSNPISSISPIPPHPVTPSVLDLVTMFGNAGLLFFNGSRGTPCGSTGDVYVSFSGGFGGSGIFRVNAALNTSTLVATIGMNGNEGLQDMMTGPSIMGNGTSLFFTVHDVASGGEEVWELTLPECPQSECFLVIGRSAGSGSFTAVDHTWSTQVDEIYAYYPVLLDDMPSFLVPAADLGPGVQRGRLRMFPVMPFHSIHAQVLMWNPPVFPANPEQFSNGITVTMWTNGMVSATPYGASDGMSVWLDTYQGADGNSYYRFPFSIEGL